jgi:putative oxidoreductase
MPTRTLYDIVALVARLGVGSVFVAQGWDKIRDGIDQTAESFAREGVAFPEFAAVYSTFSELLCGVMLIVGFGLPVAGVLLFLDMAGSLVLAQTGGFSPGEPLGFQLGLVLALTALLFACGGAGRMTADRWLLARRTESPPEPNRGDAAGLQRFDRRSRTEKDRTDKRETKETKAKKKKPDPVDEASWVAELPEERPFEYVSPSTALSSTSSTPKLASDIVGGSGNDVLVAGKRTGRAKSRATGTGGSTGSAGRKAPGTGKDTRTGKSTRSGRSTRSTGSSDRTDRDQ